MPPDTLNVAVFGAGYWGRKLVGEYLSLSKSRSDVELKFVVDPDKERLKTVGKEFGLPSNMMEADASTVLNDTSVSAVHLAIPNEQHYPIGMAALEAHKHVLLEKPMALTMRDAIKLARKAEEGNLVLHIAHIFRFNNAVQQAQAFLTNDAIGNPLYYRLAWEALVDPPEGRDIIFDLGPHPIDVLNYLTNEWPSRVLSLGRYFRRGKSERADVAEAVMEFEDGTFANVALSWLYAGPKKRAVSITGDSGTLEIDALNQKITVYNKEGVRFHQVEANNTIQAMINHFTNSIQVREPPKVSALVGAMTVAVLCAMRRSMKTKRFMPVIGA
jgi:UDP-N-acetylglucosamine 3-dehydrogenase